VGVRRFPTASAVGAGADPSPFAGPGRGARSARAP